MPNNVQVLFRSTGLLIDSIVANSTSWSQGGITAFYLSNLTIINCVISGATSLINGASLGGGVLVAYADAVLIRDTVFEDNQASNGARPTSAARSGARLNDIQNMHGHRASAFLARARYQSQNAVARANHM